MLTKAKRMTPYLTVAVYNILRAHPHPEMQSRMQLIGTMPPNGLVLQLCVKKRL
jgi:hypothetical protein